ncbi:MAG: dTDP-4-dehydrorhamnose reductase [Treponema sp.]|nr:dTDP-4-dehydrorhamnose reductase [Treponema sp.]
MIWLIGNKGMLGTEISLLMQKSGISFVGTDNEVDITKLAELEVFVNKQALPITWIINCAAYTAVDKAEDDTEICSRINTFGAGNISKCAKNSGARLIHISTDYVFDGTSTQPYREDDTTNPIGIYGISKRNGELAVMENNPHSYIIRTSWLYGKYGNNFVHTMLRLMNERDEIKVVDDQRGNPTWAYNLAVVILGLIEAANDKDIPFGIYHFTNKGNITWFDFAKEIYRQGKEMGLIKKDCNVSACTSAEYPAKVKRPAYSVLDKSKIKAALEVEIPLWETSLKEFFQRQ